MPAIWTDKKITHEADRLNHLIPMHKTASKPPPKSLHKSAAKLILVFLFCATSHAALDRHASRIDSDHDGLSDPFEAALLARFAPQFMISRHDCSVQPAHFASGIVAPEALAEDGTIYAQAFPRQTSSGRRSDTEVELHYYHLWRTDCGRMGHPLDAEHVSVLLRGRGGDPQDWHAIYWYAAAHEDTVCDASQVTRASTLHAEDHGATIWISAGKHASFLNEELCHHGCGGDRCIDPEPMKIAALLNLGELPTPMEGAIWVHSPRWPLDEKMRRSDFGSIRVDRLEALPATDIAWANPSLRPVEATISGGNAAIDGTFIGAAATTDAVAQSHRRTDTALVIAGGHTDNALSNSRRNTGDALANTYRKVRKALGTAAGKTCTALSGCDTSPGQAASPE